MLARGTTDKDFGYGLSTKDIISLVTNILDNEYKSSLAW